MAYVQYDDPRDEEILPPADEPPPPVTPWESFAPTGDADRGYTATTPDDVPEYPVAEEPWVAEGPTRALTWQEAEDRGGWGSGPGGSLGWWEYSAPQGILPTGARGMDPQMRDLIEAGPMPYIAGMNPSTAPMLGIFSVPEDEWGRYPYPDEVSQSLSAMPASLGAGRGPARGTSLDIDYAKEGNVGQYDIGQRSITGAHPSAITHELLHAMDYQGQMEPQLSRDPRFDIGDLADAPKYRSWEQHYGPTYLERIPEEVLANEGARLQFGVPTSLTPASEAYLRERLYQIPPETPRNPANPYLPGSVQYANYEQWLENQRNAALTYPGTRGAW